MAHQIQINQSAMVDTTPQDSLQDDHHTHQIIPDLAYKRLGIVHVAFVGIAVPASGKYVKAPAFAEDGSAYI